MRSTHAQDQKILYQVEFNKITTFFKMSFHTFAQSEFMQLQNNNRNSPITQYINELYYFVYIYSSNLLFFWRFAAISLSSRSNIYCLGFCIASTLLIIVLFTDNLPSPKSCAISLYAFFSYFSATTNIHPPRLFAESWI